MRSIVTAFVGAQQRDGGAVHHATRWVAERFSDAAFERHLPASPDVGDILAQGQRNVSGPLNDMVEANMRLAVAVARRHLGRCRHLDLRDLCHEAWLAVRKAALFFDADKEHSFATYATPAIEHRLCSAIRTAKGPKENQACQVEEFRIAQASLAHELKRLPTNAEVFGRLPEWSPEVCESVQAVLRAFSPRPLPGRNETSETSVADRSADGPSEAEAHESSERLLAAIARLPENERQVVHRHYFEHTSFAQIERSLGLSEGTARRRHKKALDTLARELVGAAAPAESRERA